MHTNLQFVTKTAQKLLKILRISVNLYHKLQKTAFIGGSFYKTNPIAGLRPEILSTNL